MRAGSLYQYKEYDYSYEYDYVFCGGGLAGLSLLMRMVRHEHFRDKTFCLLDRDPKQVNDRTWCYWEQGEGFFEPIVYRRWDKTWFHGQGYSKQYDLAPYQYKMIRGIDLYTYCYDYLKSCSNVRLVFEPVERVGNWIGRAMVELHNLEVYHANEWVFNSVLFEPPGKQPGEQYLLQHFKGWVIETQEPFFESGTNTLMDFRVDQRHGTTFVYVMPLDERRALVEYTLFTEELLQEEEYDAGLRQYIGEWLGLEHYTVREEEKGVIPMTGHRFPDRDGRIINIGTAGGQTKPSSGFTFQFVQQHSQDIVDSLVKQGHPFPPSRQGGRYRFYDRVLLDVLASGALQGDAVFTQLFRGNPVTRIFRFLDNRTNLLEDLLLVGSLPSMPFLRAALRVW